MLTKITKKHLNKVAAILAVAVFLVVAVGCGGTVVEVAPPGNASGPIAPSPNPAGQNEQAQQNNSAPESVPDAAPAPAPASETAGGNHHDFSLLGGPVLHAVFTNLEHSPENFAGDRITVRAEYLVVHNDDKSLPCQHFLFVMDARGCCPVMIRIKYRDNNCPDDYPENMSIVEAHGIFRPFERDGRVIYHYLAVETLTVLG